MGQCVMDYIIVLIGLLSIFDLHCTLQWIADNPYVEANPIMRWLWFANPVYFILSKIVITLMFCLIALRLKNNNLLRRLIWLPFCAYALAAFIHCGGWI